MVCFSVLLVSFVTIYLGIGNLLLTAMRRIQPVSLFLTLLIHFLLLLTGVGTPLIIRGLAFGWRDEYFLLQISDPFSTLIEAGRGRMMLTAPTGPVILGIAALVVFLLNLPLAARELRQTRIARPQRVEQEDAELAAAHAPPPEPNDPWEAEAVQA